MIKVILLIIARAAPHVFLCTLKVDYNAHYNPTNYKYFTDFNIRFRNFLSFEIQFWNFLDFEIQFRIFSKFQNFVLDFLAFGN